MVSSIIPTSTWSHNCGMHVIADFLVERLQQDDFQATFTGKAYDELLKSFQDIYQQKELTWETIRDASLDSSRTDTQVIWGFVLRQMLPTILKSKIEFKKDLKTHFLSIFNLLRENRDVDAFENHPILFIGNEQYLRKKVKELISENNIEIEGKLEEIKSYWDSHGFQDYCEATLSTSEDDSTFVWLEAAEIVHCAKYFDIEAVNINYQSNVPYDADKLFFKNPSQQHWVRDVKLNRKINLETIYYDSKFLETHLSAKIEDFYQKLEQIGKQYFSDEYVKSEREIMLSIDPKDEPLKRYILNNNKQAFIDYLKSNQNIQSNEITEAISLAVCFFTTSEMIDWLKSDDFMRAIKIKYEKILYIATEHNKKHLVKTLLVEFAHKYTAEICMPALLLAAKQNNDFIVHVILNTPGFSKTGLKDKVIFNLTPAFSYVLNQYDEHGIPAVYYAIENQNIDLVTKLINKGVCLTYMVNKQNGLMRALETQNLKLISLLLNQTISHHEWNTKNSKGENQFHIAAKQNAIHYLEKFNMQWKGLDSRNAEGMNCLHITAMLGHIEGIAFSLKNGCSHFSKDNKKNTPLHLAAQYGQIEAVKYLTEELQKLNSETLISWNKFDFNSQNAQSCTPLRLAYKANHLEIVNYFRTIGCVDLLQETFRQLYRACLTSDNAIEEIIEKNKKAIFLADENNDTLLHYISRFCKNKNASIIVQSLIKHGAKIEAKNNQSKTPLHFAAESNNTNIVSVLLENKAFIDSLDVNGLTACHVAASVDAKNAFDLLVEKQASLTIEIFPFANSLFGAEPEERLNAIKIAEKKSGKIAKALKEKDKLEHDRIIDKSSLEQRAIKWINPYIGNIYTETEDLEKTDMYHRLGLLKIGLCVLYKLPEGCITGTALELAKQTLLYAKPMVMQASGEFYYYLKPKLHNHAWPCISKGFDYGSTTLGLGVHGLFAGMNYYDLYMNPGRRAFGFIGAQSAVKLAKKYAPNDKNVQAASLFAGRELGFFIVDAYNAASPERKAYNAQALFRLDPALNQAYEIWTSLLGKSTAEYLMYYAHAFKASQNQGYTNVGDAERWLVESIPGYAQLCYIKNEASLIFGNTINFCSPDMIKSGVNTILDCFNENLDRVLIELKRTTHTHLVPESEYRNLILSYAHQEYVSLLQDKKQGLEIRLRHAEENGKTNEAKLIKNQIDALLQEIIDGETAAKNFYEQVSKGKITNEIYLAQAEESKSWNDQHHLKVIKNLNPDDFVDEGIEALGEDLSSYALSKYVVEKFRLHDIDIDNEDLSQFESHFESLDIKSVDFNQEAKSAFSVFFHSQTDKHIQAKSIFINETYEKNKSKLENLEGDFTSQATPEELRVLTLNKNPEIKKQKYDLLAEYKSTYIQSAALIRARYAVVIKASAERDDAKNNVIYAESNLDHSIIDIDQEINVLEKTYNPLRTNYELNKEQLKPESVMSDLKKIIQDGNEGKDRRDYGTNLLLSCLVKTGLISYDMAVKNYKHDFYESLKVKGNELENSVNTAFGKAMSEVLKNAEATLGKVDQKIVDLNHKLNEDKQQVHTAREILRQKESTYEQSKINILNKLNPEEKAEFKLFFRNLDTVVSKLNNYNEVLSEKQFADQNYQTGVDRVDDINTLIQSKQIDLTKLDQFIVTDNDIWDLVNDAVKSNSNTTEVNKYIINYFVQKGVGTYEQLTTQLWNTLCSAQKSSDDKYLIKHLYKRLCGQVEVINTQSIPNQKINLKNEIEKLSIQKTSLNQDVEQLKLIQKNVTERADLAKVQYIEKLPVEQREQFQSTLDNNFDNQQNITNEIDIKNIFGIVGQGQLALEAAVYQDFLSEYGQSSLRVSMIMAKKLLDYKYRFLPKPNETEYQEELQVCTSSLHVVEQAKAFDSVKLSIDASIAQFVYHQANVSGESVPNILNNILQTNILTNNNNIAHISSLDLNQPGPAMKTIQQFIQAEVKSISIAKMGEHAIEKIWMPSVPKHHGKWHRATNNVKKMYHDNKSLLVSAAALVAAIIAAKMGGLKVAFNFILVSGRSAAEAKIFGGNEEKNDEKTAFQQMQRNHHSGVEAARNELHHNLRMVETENQARYDNLARRTEQNSFYMQNHEQHHQASHTTSVEPHVPSFENSVFQGGVFGQQQQEAAYPGPLRTEQLPANLQNSASRTHVAASTDLPEGGKVYLPFAYQQNAARATSTSSLPSQPSSGISNKEQGNMINGWENTDKSTAPMTGSEALHSILPRYKNIFLEPVTQQATSSTPSPQKAPVKVPTASLPPSKPSNRSSSKSQGKPSKDKGHGDKKPPKPNLDMKKIVTPEEINQIKDLYESFKNKAEAYLTSCGAKSDVRKNTCINSAYYQAGIVNPYLLWPMAAVLGSAKVGQNIALTQQIDTLTFGVNSEIHELGIQLPEGNQAIFKDVMPLWMLYKEKGYAGIQHIKDKLMDDYKDSDKYIDRAFKQQEILDRKVKDLAFSMGLPANSPKVLNTFFADSANREMALKISMSLVHHEQTVVQKIYTNSVNSALTNPVNIAMGSFLHLDGVTVNGKRFSFSEWVKDPSNFEQRMAYFRAIFTEIVSLHAHPTQIQSYQELARKELVFSVIRAQPVDTFQVWTSPWQKAANDFTSKAVKLVNSPDGGNVNQFKKLN